MSSAWTTLGCILASYIILELAVTNKIDRKSGQHPLVSGILKPILIPRFILNLIFAGNAANLIQQGYQKYKTKSYQLVRQDNSIVILPLSLLDELSSLPEKVASPSTALEHDLVGSYTGINLILENRLHHSIVQRKLTPRLEVMTPHLEEEVNFAFDDFFPKSNDSEWQEFQPYQVFGRISARLSARALVGPSLCRDPKWVDISFNYTENLFRTLVVLRLFPSWIRPLLCQALPSYHKGRSYLKAAKALLGPKIQDLINRNNNGSWSTEDNEKDSNVLAWLAEFAKGVDRDADTLAHVEVLLALASVHTTLLRMVNVLYDLTANPQYLEELSLEIQNEWESKEGWNSTSYSRLHKMDSVLRESQRMSPPTTLGLKRLFKQSHTFSNGLHVREGSYVCLPTFAIENDPLHTKNPETFDGLRAYWQKKQESSGGQLAAKNAARYDFSSPDHTVLNFGYGKTACPGRFFASLIIKIFFVKLLTEYEFSFLSNTGRPKNLMVHEFLFCWPWQKMLVRKKPVGDCPF